MAVIRGGYWRSSEAVNFPPESIQTSYFTHLFYATVAIDSQTYQLRLSHIDRAWMKRFTSILSENKDMKCILSIGEDTEAGRTAFSDMISTTDGRKSFIGDSIKVARENGFHGLDLYWKYPATQNEFDMPNLWLLFKEWRHRLNEESSSSGNPRLFLSTIVYFAPKIIQPNKTIVYPFKSIKDNVDFVNLVCYGYYGSGQITEQHALLYDQQGKISTHYGISSWIDDAGFPEEQLVMGLPLYGKTWKLASLTHNGIGASTVQGSMPGVKDYSDILIFNRDRQAKVKDDKTVSTYSVAGNDWIGYDSKNSIKEKVQYAKDHALGGYFFWALGMDKDYELPQQAKETWS